MENSQTASFFLGIMDRSTPPGYRLLDGPWTDRFYAIKLPTLEASKLSEDDYATVAQSVANGWR